MICENVWGKLYIWEISNWKNVFGKFLNLWKTPKTCLNNTTTWQVKYCCKADLTRGWSAGEIILVLVVRASRLITAPRLRLASRVEVRRGRRWTTVTRPLGTVGFLTIPTIWKDEVFFKGDFPSGNFPNSQFPKPQLPKGRLCLLQWGPESCD